VASVAGQTFALTFRSPDSSRNSDGFTPSTTSGKTKCLCSQRFFRFVFAFSDSDYFEFGFFFFFFGGGGGGFVVVR
jgi:hypothetical protein